MAAESEETSEQQFNIVFPQLHIHTETMKYAHRTPLEDLDPHL